MDPFNSIASEKEHQTESNRCEGVVINQSTLSSNVWFENYFCLADSSPSEEACYSRQHQAANPFRLLTDGKSVILWKILSLSGHESWNLKIFHFGNLSVLARWLGVTSHEDHRSEQRLLLFRYFHFVPYLIRRLDAFIIAPILGTKQSSPISGTFSPLHLANLFF
ncbi:hypothetical protein EUGRSUZ_C03131 [Eucalyptus grandis]|uniref:Uncharacterized protein n=2 Tax=Eucalyptus grandis TaxID=71139 RepID=A0ACC3LJQ1_EUCGR|nr:hypothetical protein EUGRSUZ_C03131 [Eucalyptus grandis]